MMPRRASRRWATSSPTRTTTSAAGAGWAGGFRHSPRAGRGCRTARTGCGAATLPAPAAHATIWRHRGAKPSHWVNGAGTSDLFGSPPNPAPHTSTLPRPNVQTAAAGTRSASSAVRISAQFAFARGLSRPSRGPSIWSVPRKNSLSGAGVRHTVLTDGAAAQSSPASAGCSRAGRDAPAGRLRRATGTSLPAGRSFALPAAAAVPQPGPGL